jgi:tRNA(Ile)-lysidine synthase
MQFSSTTSAAAKNKSSPLLVSLAHAAAWRPGERLAVAVSGGADSVALLLLLLELREKLGLVLSVVHLNHQLRGRASDADENFVAKLAAKHHLDFFLERLNAAAKAKREKANLEDTARRARYDFFSRLVAEKKLDRVAVAHTADDQAETVLAHILRGTGLAGLGGIHPQTACVIRPLLHIRRAALRAYLRSKKQSWREDATNQDTARMRARIRKKLLPLLEKQFQPAIVAHLVSLADFAREDESFLDQLADQHYSASVQQTPQGLRVSTNLFSAPSVPSVLKNTHPPASMKSGRPSSSLTKRVLRRLINKVKQSSAKGRTREAHHPQITAQHLEAVLALAEHGEPGKALQLPGRLEVRRERNSLLIFSRNVEPPKKQQARRHPPESPPDYQHPIHWKSEATPLRIATPHCVFRFTLIDWPENRVDTRQLGTVLDRARLRFPLVLRNWRPGDRLQPQGHQKAHKLKRLFNEKRISRWDRQGWPVLASGDTLVWARGFPVAAGFAASAETREAVVIAEEL